MLVMKTVSLRYLPFVLLFWILQTGCSQAQDPPEWTEVYEPEPAVVPASPMFTPAPQDAIILFDASNLNEWQTGDESDAQWEVSGDHFTVVPGTGDIHTRRAFGDVQLHLEFRAPVEIDGDGQGRGNSGVFLQERYEVQVLDNWNNPTYVNGMAGSIYKQHIPLANPARRPGEWQSYDIFFKAPRFDEGGHLVEAARITVLLNGVLVQNNVELLGPTVFRGRPSYESHGMDTIRLQDHTDRVSYRNIWIRPLDEAIQDADGVRSEGL